MHKSRHKLGELDLIWVDVIYMDAWKREGCKRFEVYERERERESTGRPWTLKCGGSEVGTVKRWLDH